MSHAGGDTKSGSNARLYSPYLGRFVSPDPLLNSEGSAWDYNPYVYANNNPVKYIDRNGEFIIFPILSFLQYFLGNDAAVKACSVVATTLSIGVGAYVGSVVTAGVGSIGVSIGSPVIAGAAPVIGAGVGAAAGYLTYNLAYSGLTGTPFNFSWSQLGVDVATAMATAGLCTVASKLAPKVSKIMQTRHRPTAMEPDVILPQASKDAPIYSQPDPADVLKQAGIQAGQGNSSVYVGRDAENKIRYVGRTDRKPEIRFQEHFHDGSKKSIIVKFEPIKTTLDHNSSRAAEQILINKYGMKKNGGDLINKVNSISPKQWKKFGVE